MRQQTQNLYKIMNGKKIMTFQISQAINFHQQKKIFLARQNDINKSFIFIYLRYIENFMFQLYIF